MFRFLRVAFGPRNRSCNAFNQIPWLHSSIKNMATTETDTKPLLYFTPLGAPCRAVVLSARALHVDLQYHIIDMHKKREHLEDWFRNINPQCTTPTLVDGDFVLWESRAINKYLAMKQMNTEHRDVAAQLWPMDPQQQSLVDRLLYYDMGTLYQSMISYFAPQLMLGMAPDKNKLAAFENSLRMLDIFLQKSEFAAGEKLTLADISLITSISQLKSYGYDMDPNKYKQIVRWEKAVIDQLPFYEEVSREGLNASAQWAASKMKKPENQ